MPLNKTQQKALNIMLSGQNIFLSGKAGTGKSFVLQKFIEQCSKKKQIIICAPTGIAALNINGSTIHKVFKAPIRPIIEKVSSNIKNDILETADIIIIDEISMCRCDLFSYVCQCIKIAEKRTKTKKQLIVVGDFFQLPPVVSDKDREILEQGLTYNIKEGFAFSSPYWYNMHFHTIMLNKIIRQSNQTFITHLNNIRNGNRISEAIDYINQNSAVKPNKNAITLCRTNTAAAIINNKNIEEINKPARIYYATTEGVFNNSDKPTDDILILKVGARVMALINNEKNHYANGSIGTVTRLTKDHVYVTFDDTLKNVKIPYNEWKNQKYTVVTDKNGNKKLDLKTIGSFKQIPLKLAYAITIHKSQGKTFEYATLSIDDSEKINNGQIYVALSRVTSIDGLYLKQPLNPLSVKTSKTVQAFYKKKKEHIYHEKHEHH